MKGNLSLVGASASASKREAQLRGREVLACVEIEPSENGGYSVRQRYRVEAPTGRKLVDCVNRYIEPKTLVFESAASLFAHLREQLR